MLTSFKELYPYGKLLERQEELEIRKKSGVDKDFPESKSV